MVKLHMTELGQQIFERTYARQKPDGEMETWEDTIERVVSGNTALAPAPVGEEEKTRLRELMREHKLVPAGRHLYMAGVPGRQFLSNCHVAGWGEDFSEHFTFTLLRLMEGGGVGSNYSLKYLMDYKIRNLVSVHILCDRDHKDYKSLTGHLSDEACLPGIGEIGSIKVEDSREGWAGALKAVIDAATLEDPRTAGIYVTDVDGPGLFHVNVILDVSGVRPAGSEIKTFGGTSAGPLPLVRLLRETAFILGKMWTQGVDGINCMDLDHKIASCVISGNVRRSARMSMMRWDDPCIDLFLSCKEDTSKHWSTNISVEIDDRFISLLNDAEGHDHPARKNAREVWGKIVGGMARNGEPGFWNRTLAQEGEQRELIGTNPCVSGDTVIATVEGPRPFSELAESGNDIEVYSWDPETKTPVVRWMRNPRLTRKNAETVIVEFDSGLKVRCTPDHKFYSFRGEKVEARSLRVGQPVRAFSASRDSSGHERIHRNKNHKVISVTEASPADVYNGTVDGSHTYVILDPEPVSGHMSGIVSANCGELGLEPWEACNIGNVNLAAFVDENGVVDHSGLYEAHRLMTRFLIRATFGDYSDPKQREVVERNRRIMVGHLGYAWFTALQGIKYSESWKSEKIYAILGELKTVVRAEASAYAFRLRIPAPIKVTGVAPTGTVSKLSGVTPGIQPVYARWFIQRIRFSNIDPDQAAQVKEYRGKGYKAVPDIYAENTTVVEIPMKDPILDYVDQAVVEDASEISIRDALNVQAMYQEWYADNSVSYTVNVPPQDRLAETLEETIPKFAGEIKGTTIMVDETRKLAPWERISEDQYKTEAWGRATASGQAGPGCANGACPVR